MMMLKPYGPLFKNNLVFNPDLRKTTTVKCFSKTRKGGMKISEYLTLMEKKKIDNLQLVGYPMDLRSFISHVIAGLDDDYTPIVCVIRNRDMTWSEIQFELLSYEQRMDRLQAMKNNQISPLQSIVSAGKHCSSYDSSSNDQYQTNQNSGSYYNYGRKKSILSLYVKRETNMSNLYKIWPLCCHV